MDVSGGGRARTQSDARTYTQIIFISQTLLISSIDAHGYLHSADPKVHNENLLNSAQFLGPFHLSPG